MVIILSRKHFTVWVIPADMEDNTLFTNNKIQKKRRRTGSLNFLKSVAR